jgi:agmatinase
MMGHLITHGAWVKRLINEGHVPGKNFIQVGLRGCYPEEESFDWMRQKGFRYHTMAEVERRGWDAVMEDVIKEAKDGPSIFSSPSTSIRSIQRSCPAQARPSPVA